MIGSEVHAAALAIEASRSLALLTVAAILADLAAWDTADPAAFDEADVELHASWGLRAATLAVAAGSGWSGPLLDVAGELRREASRPTPIVAGVELPAQLRADR